LTGSADHTVIVWRPKNDQWIPVHTITEHKQPILSIGIMKGVHLPIETFAVGSSDGMVTLWSLTDTECVQLDTLNLGNTYAFSMVMAYLPNTQIPMLMVGGTDKLISIYCWQNGKFEKKLSLSGHLDWIRCLDICQSGHSLLLASGAQDKYIRLWKIFSLSEDEAQLTNKTSQSESLTMEMIQALAEADM
jgi:elongator complex protein 2